MPRILLGSRASISQQQVNISTAKLCEENNRLHRVHYLISYSARGAWCFSLYLFAE